jgi:glutamine amidotransferase
MLFHFSEEGNVEGLGLLKGKVKRFVKKADLDMKIPHMGWNNVEQNSSHPLWSNVKNNDRFYFVHSYFVNESDQSIVQGLTNYDVSFTSAVAKDNLFAVQFHPEKSGDAGLKILSNFVSWKC